MDTTTQSNQRLARNAKKMGEAPVVYDPELTEISMQQLRQHVSKRLAEPLAAPEYMQRLQSVYAQHPTDQSMRDRAGAVQEVPLAIVPPMSAAHKKLH